MFLDNIDRWFHEMPEPKLQLIDGRLVVGNGDAGNRRLLAHLLEGWGAEAALPMAPPETWRQALQTAFREFDSPAIGKPLDVWRSWAAQLSYTPDIPQAGPMIDPAHRGVRQLLTMSLYGLAHEHEFAQVFGRDVLMRLGDDGFTPDVVVVGPNHCERLNDHYLDGPADVVIEVLSPGHEGQDRGLKRDHYERGGVTEYWMVDPARKTVELFRLEAGRYQSHRLDGDGSYRPAPFPGLVFSPDKIWEVDSWGRGPNPFRLDGPMPSVERGFSEDGVSWGDLPFDPRPALEPRPISFEEFASWAPEAKFELIDGKPWVGGSRGSRNVIGLLLRTEGLVKAVTVLHPGKWLAALALADSERATDAERRAHWWEVARRAAADLRNRFGYTRLVVIGDLVRARPINFWSDVTIVALDVREGQSTWDACQFLYDHYQDGPDINLLEYDHASRSEQEETAAGGVEV